MGGFPNTLVASSRKDPGVRSRSQPAVWWGSSRRYSDRCAALQRFQPLLLVQFQQRVDQWVHFACHDGVEVEVLFAAAFAAEAVVGAAVLWKVVGADALAAVAA